MTAVRPTDLDPAIAAQLKRDKDGLVVAVCQQHDTGEVLMVGWMDDQALHLTLTTGRCTYWSRSRQEYWVKGETSGHRQWVREVRLDCDGDALLLVVEPAGPACHTGKPSCFFRRLPDGAEDDGPGGAPAAVLDRLRATIEARKSSTAQASYTRSLLDGGWPRILAKIAEEHGELAAELPEGPPGAIVHEAADLLYHLLVGLAARQVPARAVWAELERRFGTSGHDEKRSRPPPKQDG